MIVAELGTLHNSSYENLIEATKDCIRNGAEAVKVQCINPDTAHWASNEQRDRYERIYWTPEKWAVYFSFCKAKYKVPVFPSVFDKEFIEPLNDHVPFWKVGYKARMSTSLVDKLIKTGKPVYISTTDYDIKLLKSMYLTENVRFIYVIPEYPISFDRAYLPLMGDYCRFKGASLHTKDLKLILAAQLMGSEYTEVHVQGVGASGIDTTFALTIDELNKLVELNRTIMLLQDQVKVNKTLTSGVGEVVEVKGKSL